MSYFADAIQNVIDYLQDPRSSGGVTVGGVHYASDAAAPVHGAAMRPRESIAAALILAACAIVVAWGYHLAVGS